MEFLNTLDIVGYNYVDRWHERREIFAEQDRQAHPNWKLIGTESGSIFESRDERYSLGDDPAVARPNYTSGMVQAERMWKWVMLRDYFAGNFMWTGTRLPGGGDVAVQGVRLWSARYRRSPQGRLLSVPEPLDEGASP